MGNHLIITAENGHRLRVLVLFGLASTAMGIASLAAPAPAELYRLDRIESDGTVVLHRYSSAEVSRLKFSLLSFPQNFRGADSPIR